MTTTPVPTVVGDDLALRLGTLALLVAAALALGAAGLITAPVAGVTMILTLTTGLAVPTWIPHLVHDSPLRTTMALAAIGLLIAVTAASGSGALFTGELSGPLSTAVSELALPDGVPIGLLAALAAGALVAVSLELGERRGVQSALVLGIAVLGLASVAAPGQKLLPALVLGWPAALFTLTQLAAGATRAPVLPTGRPAARPSARAARPAGPSPRDPRPLTMHRSPATGPRSFRAVTRWQLVPVLAVITVSLAVLTALLLSGAASLADRSPGFGTAGGFGNSPGNRSTSDYLGGDMDLTSRGELPTTPVMDVPADSPRLWRAGTLSEYNGRGWLATVPARGLPDAVVRADGAVEVRDPAAPLQPVNARTDEVRPRRAGATQVLAPGRLLTLTSPRLNSGGRALISTGDRIILAGGSGTIAYQVNSAVLPAVTDLNADTLLTAAAVPDEESSDGPDTGVEGSGVEGSGVESSGVDNDIGADEALDPRWTTVPSTVPERVLQLGQSLVNAAPSRLAAVRAIETELDRRMTYDLDSPVTPPDQDVVDDVLFVTHRGFCEHFASAEVILLRAAGVPARMAVGFSAAGPEQDGYRTVRRSEAHAWVEVWFPGVGWVTSDPTPAADLDTGREDGLKAALRWLWERPEVWVPSLIVVLALAFLIVRQVRRRTRAARPVEIPERLVDPDLAAAFTRLEAGLRAEGRPRASNETVAALSQRLIRQQQLELTLPPDPTLADALTVLERALYAPEPPSRPECLSAAAVIDRRASHRSKQSRQSKQSKQSRQSRQSRPFAGRH